MNRSIKTFAIVVALAAMSGCASKEELQHAENRVDSTRTFYQCKTLAQKQLSINVFQTCYVSSPKTKQNRQECEEHARAMACDRVDE